MSWRDHRRERHWSEPVDGSFRMLSYDDLHKTSGTGLAAGHKVRMKGMVTAPGLEPAAVEIEDWVGLEWMHPGVTLPVRVDRAEPSQLYVDWKEVDRQRDQEDERQQLEAEQQAAREWAAEQPPGSPSGESG